MEKENKDRLLDAPEVYYRLRKCSSVLQMNNEELAEKFGISRAYLQKCCLVKMQFQDLL